MNIHPCGGANVHKQRRGIVKALAGAALLGPAALVRSQTEWAPSGPVRIIVPFAAGGPADVTARLVQPGLTQRLKQPVLVENRPGATGSIANEYVYGQPPDGKTLVLGGPDTLSIYPNIAKVRFDAMRFEPVAGIAKQPLVLMARADLPANNLHELVALMKKQSLNCANAGPGSLPHVMMVAFQRAAGIENANHVPYPGAIPALNGLLGKHVDVLFLPLGISGEYRSRLKIFGVTSPTRVAAMADVPTLSEQGLAVVGETWQGLLAPPRTAQAVSETIAQATREIVGSADFQAKAAELGLAPMLQSHAEFTRYYADEYQRWGEIVHAASIRLE